MHGSRPTSEGIAIVGMACVYPDARTPVELWENVLAQRRAFRRIPPERLRLEDYWSADSFAPDHTYSTEAAVIEGYDFDRITFRAVGSTFRSADMSHWLALDVAARALADAGFAEGRGLPREATGVLLGNTLTGEFSRANTLRLRWPYVRRVLDAALVREGWSVITREGFLQRVEADYKAPFPPVGEETLAGGLSNTIAGRICNQFDFQGGGYTLDGACASSLLAVANACSSLAAGDLDAALAGGVDLSLDPFELVGFAKTGALAADDMRLFDQRSAGFWPGEGCGFAVLMRHADALAQGCRIYAVIRGWGISSDGSGGITRPDAGGQLEALRRAYRRAGFTSDTVTYCEAHGTGTAVGDATELEVLSRARCEANPSAPAAVLGSIKANIGHTKAAAGIAGLIKATMAVHSQVLPPTTGCPQPHRQLREPGAALRILREPQLWPEDRPLRAAVSAMGFGGINAHVVLESTTTERRQALGPRELSLSSSYQDAELFLFSAPDTETLRAKIQKMLPLAGGLSRSELTDLAAALERRLDNGSVRAAIVASRPAELAARLDTLVNWLETDALLKISNGVYLAATHRPPRVGFLFPGQGSPVYTDGGLWARRFAAVHEFYSRAELPLDGDLVSTRTAQPAVIAASLAGLRVLEKFGVTADVALGHSLGELAALHWSGVISEPALLRIARVRASAMASLASVGGAMAAIAAPAEQVQPVLDSDQVTIVGFNSPRQTVVAGATDSIHHLVRRAASAGLPASLLPVSHAFHTSLVAGAVPALARQLEQEQFGVIMRPVFSTITGSQLPPGSDVAGLLCRQVTSPVRFSEALAALLSADQPIDLLLEVGPGSVLTGLVRDTTTTPVIALDAAGPSLDGLLNALGAAFVLGTRILHKELFAGRFTRPFDPERKPKFFASPCESAPIAGDDARSLSQSSSSSFQHASSSSSLSPGGEGERGALPTERTSPEPQGVFHSTAPSDTLSLVRHLVAQRAELPLASIQDSDRMLSDLHLNSITVGHLVSEAARSLRLPPITALTEFANASVSEITEALNLLQKNGTHERAHKRQPEGVDTWFRMFTLDWVEAPQPAPVRHGSNGAIGKTSGWQMFSVENHSLVGPLKKKLQQAGGSGVALWLPENPGDAHLALMLAAARAVMAIDSHPRFLVVQHGWGASGFARTLHLETPGLTTCVVNVPVSDSRALDWIAAEAASATGFIEARYDQHGRRYEPRLRLADFNPVQNAGVRATNGHNPKFEKAGSNRSPSPGGEGRGEDECDVRPHGSEVEPLSRDDVVLVTGGGKGIAAECALTLGRSTGAAIALLGRSALKDDPILVENLARFAAAKVRCCYVRGDVTDPSAVKTAVAEAQRQLGAITAVVHGAGANTPQLIGALEESASRRTLAPKVEGARNVLGALDATRLKLFVTFGSIIARTGLQGEADYAAANEWLRALTDDFQSQHPACRCLTVEWSVWSGVGMGQRLGRVETLLELGIVPIPVDEGVRLFLEAVRLPKRDSTAIVISGRFGQPPTLKLAAPELPLLRFLEHNRVYYPGVELVVDASLSPATDLYLEEHVLQNQILLPAVIGLEAMAQAAMALTGAKSSPVLERIELPRPVVISRSGSTTIRVAALRRAPDLVEVCLRSEESDFHVDQFRAFCRFESSSCSSSSSSQEESSSSSSTPSPRGEGECNARRAERPHLVSYKEDDEVSPLPLNPSQDLYGPLLFHAGRFRRVGNYSRLSATECIAEIVPGASNRWFSSYLPVEFVLGDAAARDAALHAIQACIPHRRILPTGIDKLTILRVEPAATARTVRAVERSRNGDDFIYDVQLTNSAGELLEHWEGLRLRAIENLAEPTAWPCALLAPFLGRRIEDLAAGSIKIAFHRASNGSNGNGNGHSHTDSCLHEALGRNVPIFRRPDGKPVVERSADASSARTNSDAATPGGVDSLSTQTSDSGQTVRGQVVRAPQSVSTPGLEHISASHSQGFTLAIAATSECACDLEVVHVRSEMDWRGLLGEEGLLLCHQIAREQQESFDAAGTRLWAARECLKKLSRPATAPLVLLERGAVDRSPFLQSEHFPNQSAHCAPEPASGPSNAEADRGRGEDKRSLRAADKWLLLRSGNFLIATYIASVRELEHPLAIAVALQNEPANLFRPGSRATTA